MNKNRCFRKKNRTLEIIAIAGILLATACGRSSPGNFLRPGDRIQDYEWSADRALRLGIRERSIQRSFGVPYHWQPRRQLEGELEFSLLMVSSAPSNQLRFRVLIDDEAIFSHRFRADQFKPRPKLKAYFSYNVFSIPVSLKRNADLRFEVKTISPSADQPAPAGTYRLGDLRLKFEESDSFENLLIISIDTLRADAVGVYRRLLGLDGAERSYSPVLDAVAEEGVVFLNAFTTISSTWPALTSMMLSKMPFQHDVRANGQPLADNRGSLGRLMFGHGFYCVAARSNAFHLDLGGFDRVHDFFNRDRRLVQWALPLIENNHAQRFFFWFHFLGVHAAYLPGADIMAEIEDPPYEGNIKPVGPVLKKITSGEIEPTEADLRHVRLSYVGELLRLDRWLKGIFDTLKEKGLWDRTLLVITSDHGEDLYDHKRHFFHHPSIYSSSLHIPLIIKFPASRHRGVFRQNVSIMDIMPTLLDYFGIQPETELEGDSLMPLIRGEREEDMERAVFSESSDSEILAITRGSWRFIYNRNDHLPKTQYGNPYPIGHEELYHLDRDRNETHDLSTEEGGRLERLKGLLLKFLSERRFFQTRSRATPESMSEELRERLKTLGYL